MRTLLLVLAALLVVTGPGPAQPLDGDLVLSLLQTNPTTLGAVVYFNPAKPNNITTLAVNFTRQNFDNWVRMAPNNTDLVVSETDYSLSRMINIDPGGNGTTIANYLPGGIQGFELDGDDTWIVAASSTSLLGVNHSTGKWTPYVLLALYPTFNEVCILREQGIHYVVANFVTSTLKPEVKLYSADRQGLTTTLMLTTGEPLLRLCGIEVDPKSGDFITTDFDGPSSSTLEPGGVEVNRVTVGGKITTLATFAVNGAKVNQENTFWAGGLVRGSSASTAAVMKFDMSTNTVLTIVQLPTLPSSLPISTVEVYGSHPLTCNGQGGPGAAIQVSLNSQRSTAGGAAYQIACSFGRRPGLRFRNGEWLHLDLTDSLFFLTAQNLAPTIFQQFAGTLSPFGSATARIKLPASFPANLGLTVFCAAVIYTPQGVVQVTNTHWFEI
jgi:hypothetical protein